MATTKKKAAEPVKAPAAKKVTKPAAKKKPAPAPVITEPVVVKGNHLTVTTHPDGRTELEWDDAALEAEVRAAIATVEGTTNGKTNKTRKSK